MFPLGEFRRLLKPMIEIAHNFWKTNCVRRWIQGISIQKSTYTPGKNTSAICCTRTGHVSRVAIYDMKGHKLAASEDFTISMDEFISLRNRICSLKIAFAEGITVGSRFYKVHLADGANGIMGKNRDGTGCTVAKTRTIMIIGTHDNNIDPTMCNEVIMNMFDFFAQKYL